MKKFFEELQGLAWTLAGTGLVLITLSGQVRTYGIWISTVALLTHVTVAFFKDE